ncbi:MAG: hypothetical protein FWB99_05170 [Treponema sp.]|nr:hypothetical protein [Treponema sp.]
MTGSTENQGEGKPAIPPVIEDNGRRDSVFHYSRERRLSRASPEVQALNEGQGVRQSLLRIIFSNKANRMLLFAILFIFAASTLASRFMGGPGGSEGEFQAVRLGGNTLALAILPVEQTLFLILSKNTPETGEFFTGPVDIAVSPVQQAAGGESPQVFTHRIVFNLVQSELFQVSLPFEGSDFFVVLRAGEEQRSLRLRAGE